MLTGLRSLAAPLFVFVVSVLAGCAQKPWQWELVEADGEPTARHEAGFVAYKNKLYLLGGRRINPTDVFDPVTSTWTEKSSTPMEVHHFQPVVVGDAIYIVGAMTGRFPYEKPLKRVLMYYPERDEFVFGHDIPEHRRRGAAGAVYHNGKIYLVGGITHGHMRGSRPWLDEYDPKTGEWRALADAPHARDHVQAVVSDNKLYLFAGRRSSHITKQVMTLTVQHGGIYDFESESWAPVTERAALPTLRAGNYAIAWQNEIVIGGGESMTQKAAHAEVEAFNIEAQTWRAWPSQLSGRHGTGFAVADGYVYTASGSGNRGGGPELTTLERLKLPSKPVAATGITRDDTPVFKRWHTVELEFKGPETSENAEDNPFLNYRLSATLYHNNEEIRLRGFYAADGNAAESGADAGAIWKLRFSPPKTGEWRYEARLEHGDNIALSDAAGENVAISNSSGVFNVIETDVETPDFRALGRLVARDGQFYLPFLDKYWMKGGANSPENLLAYAYFDGTYRFGVHQRDGEAHAEGGLHEYAPHEQDWRDGDPTLREGSGKSIFGAMNYLAEKGMNSVYFLTMNIDGDGNDTWPFINHQEFTRFDVSKLAQWEQLFEFMQKKGILLHIVTQETENELLFDGGDTGEQRALYYHELIARFAHHPGLVWNLGEENGQPSWEKVRQNQTDDQRRQMIAFFDTNDPYNHPVLLHTQSDVKGREPILNAMLGIEALDGLSLQVHQRDQVPALVEKWRERSAEAGREWLITMDEIGEWEDGAAPDNVDPGHHSLRSDVLWGALLSGAGGVEWYFGAHHPHNDLNSEDWRARDQLWDLTSYAMDFFEKYLPWHSMSPMHEKLNIQGAYCLGKSGEIYAVYLPKDRKEAVIDLSGVEGEFELRWYNPLKGGELLEAGVTSLAAGDLVSLGVAPSHPEQDWVALLRKKVDD